MTDKTIIVNRSVCVSKILFWNFSSIYGSMSFLVPQKAFCQVPFYIYGHFFLDIFHF